MFVRVFIQHRGAIRTPKMISAFSWLCLALSIGTVVAWEAINCDNCTFYNGLGYVPSQIYAAYYYVCIPVGDDYRVELQCCPIDMTFDAEHLTCEVDKLHYLDPDRTWCPDVVTLSTFYCPYEGDERGHFFWPSGKPERRRPCAPGTVWHQDDCACVHGPYLQPCTKIIHFDFANSFDSESCYYIIDGTPHGDASLVGGALSLHGNGYVAVAFLYNWFAWNPIGNQFTFCARVKPRNANSNGCIFSTNCETSPEASLLEIGLVNGNLDAYLNSALPTAIGPAIPAGVYSDICVAYNSGQFTVCVNGASVYNANTPNMPINSQTESFIGNDPAYGFFDGEIDDVCFWTEALDKAQIANYFPHP